MEKISSSEWGRRQEQALLASTKAAMPNGRVPAKHGQTWLHGDYLNLLYGLYQEAATLDLLAEAAQRTVVSVLAKVRKLGWEVRSTSEGEWFEPLPAMLRENVDTALVQRLHATVAHFDNETMQVRLGRSATGGHIDWSLAETLAVKIASMRGTPTKSIFLTPDEPFPSLLDLHEKKVLESQVRDFLNRERSPKIPQEGSRQVNNVGVQGRSGPQIRFFSLRNDFFADRMVKLTTPKDSNPEPKKETITMNTRPFYAGVTTTFYINGAVANHMTDAQIVNAIEEIEAKANRLSGVLTPSNKIKSEIETLRAGAEQIAAFLDNRQALCSTSYTERSTAFPEGETKDSSESLTEKVARTAAAATAAAATPTERAHYVADVVDAGATQ